MFVDTGGYIKYFAPYRGWIFLM